MKRYIHYLIFAAFMILLSSCGANNPNSTNSISQTQIKNNTPSNVTINAYKGEVHKNYLTSSAITIMLNHPSDFQLTPKQIDILKNYQFAIEQGVWDEDYNNPYLLPNVLPIFRTNNHFMDPQHGNSALSDPPFGGTPQSAINWMFAGDQDMYLTAKYDYLNYITKHPVYPQDVDLYQTMLKLGHILHMFQDMTVPPHVRNDNHSGLFGAGLSSYEELGLNFNFTPNINSIIVNTNTLHITDDMDLKTKFAILAKETSENYFSDDTINDTNTNLLPSNRMFPLPNLQTLGDPANNFQFMDPVTKLIYLPNKQAPIVAAEETKWYDINGELGRIFYRYRLDDQFHIIPQYYSSQLMPKAISYTAGVIKYFLSLKGTGEVVIDNPFDGTVVYSPSVDISGHLTYYTASATVYYHLASDISREKMEIPVTYDGSQYVFSASIPLGMGDNKIEAVGFENENVDVTSANILVTYMNGGDDHDDNEDEWDDD